MKCSCSHQNDGTAVDCSSRNLVTVPDRLPKDTVVLSLKDNSIKSLSNHDLASCTRLQVLDLTMNGINRLDRNVFSSTRNLQKLFVNDNNISIFSLPLDIFDKLSNLTLLYLHNNVWKHAKTYSDSLIAHLSRLKYLSIDGIPGVNFTTGFSRLTNLTDLSIYGRLDIVTNDTFAVFRDSAISNLKIRTDALYELQPMSFAHFPSMETLDLSNNIGLGLINASCAWWGLQFTNITKLVLTSITRRGIGAVSLASEFFMYLDRTKITTVMLNKNNIVDMEPKLSSSLCYLEYVDLSYNRLSDTYSLIVDLWMLRRLQHLDFSHQEKRYVEQREIRSSEQATSLTSFKLVTDLKDKSSANMTDFFFQHCKTPRLKPCSITRLLTVMKHPLPDYGTWCLPVGRNVTVVKLSASINVNYKYMPPMVLLGGSHIKHFEYRQNGLEQWRGPVIMTGRAKNIVLDFSDNKFWCIAPDAFNVTFKQGTTFDEFILSGNNLATQMEVDISGITFKNFVQLRKLHLANNGIKKLTSGVFSHLPNIMVLNLSQNSLRQIDFEFSHMKMLQMLDLSNNLLTSLQERTLQKFSALMETSHLLINLLGNPLQCSCETQHFLKWSKHNRKQLVNFADYTCWYKGKVVRFTNLTEVVMVDLDVQCKKQTITSIIAVIAPGSLLTFLLIVIVIVVFCYQYRWKLRNFLFGPYQRLPDDTIFTYEYDAFVVYSSEDSQWVHNELVSHLENDNDQFLRLCDHERDFLLGEIIFDNISSKMEKSRKVILVISRNFIGSRWCKFETDYARHLSVEKDRNLIVPVMLEDVGMEDMSEFDSLRWIVCNLTYIEWPQWEPDREEFWQRLRASVMSNQLRLFETSL